MKDKTLCIWPLCERKAVHDELCIRHKMYSDKPEPQKQKKRINPYSKKREKQNRELGRISDKKITDDTLCQIKAVGCLIKASSLHHLQKRGVKNLTRENNLIPVCQNCNSWVERFPAIAKERGFTISKYKTA